LRNPGLELILPEAAELTTVPPPLLLPQASPGLWSGQELLARDLFAYFAGGHVVQVPRQGYDEPVTIPKADRAVIEKAVGEAVQSGQLWLVAGQASLWNEAVPPGVIAADARLRPPPATVAIAGILPDQLPEAWRDGVATAAAMADALSRQAGVTLPWPAVRQAIDSALRARVLERTVDSGPWPCEFAGASAVRLTLPGKTTGTGPPRTQTQEVEKRPGVVVAQADLKPAQVQDLADHVGELSRVAVGHEVRMNFRIEVGGAKPLPPDVLARLNEILRQVSEDLRLE
jgi:hypothetical protein